MERYFLVCVTISSTVQLKGNLMPARWLPGERVWMNLQTSTGKGVGARNVLQEPSGHPFRSSFLNTLIHIYKLPLLHYLFTVVCESLGKSSRVIID